MRQTQVFNSVYPKGTWLHFLFLVGVVLVSVFMGVIIGLQPTLMVLFAIPVVILVLLILGIRTSSKVLSGYEGWQRYIVLAFWVIVINLPTFLAFDPTALTRDHGLFNAQSIGRIVLFCVIFVTLVLFWILWFRDSKLKSHSTFPVGSGSLFALYGWYFIVALMVTTGISMGMSVFRVMEWLVAICLLSMVFSLQNISKQNALTDRVNIIIPMLLFLFFSNFVVFAIKPELIYHYSISTNTVRFGGFFTNPNLLAFVATIIVAYSVAFVTGWRRVFLVILAIIVVVFTYSRGGLAMFFIMCCLSFVFIVRSVAVKAIISLLIPTIGVLVLQFPEVIDTVARLLSRGHEQQQTLTTLSERTAVWEAAKILISESPWFGEGFNAGARRLGDIMIQYKLSTNFAAMHAHNELLQAQISGGILALFLSAFIHFRVLFLLFQVSALQNKELFFLWTVFVGCLVCGVLAPSLSYLLSLPGILLIWLLLTLEGVKKKRL